MSYGETRTRSRGTRWRPWCDAWWKRPQHMEADTHPNAILPAEHADVPVTPLLLADAADMILPAS